MNKKLFESIYRESHDFAVFKLNGKTYEAKILSINEDTGSAKIQVTLDVPIDSLEMFDNDSSLWGPKIN